jgi:hypothetical protein
MDIIAVLAAVLALGISIISMIDRGRSKIRDRILEAAERRTIMVLRIDKSDQQLQTAISSISRFLEHMENNSAFREFVESAFQGTAHEKEWASVAVLSADDLPDPVAMEKTIPDAERSLARLTRVVEENDRLLKNLRRMYDDS